MKEKAWGTQRERQGKGKTTKRKMQRKDKQCKTKERQ